MFAFFSSFSFSLSVEEAAPSPFVSPSPPSPPLLRFLFSVSLSIHCSIICDDKFFMHDVHKYFDSNSSERI